MLRSVPFLFASGLLVALVACGPEGPPAGSVEMGTSSDQEAIRTADPFARGLDHGDFPRVKELAEGVYSYEQLRSAGEEWFTTVSMFVITSEGVLVADGQGNVEETQRLVDTIAEITDQPITHVVIASDHGDHTAGNVAFPGDAAFIAHPTSEQVLRGAASRWDPASNAPPVILPTELVEDEATLEMGGREIQILFKGRAHTGGDLVVYLPEERILFMSEAYLHRVFPAMRSAFPTEWVRMIERVQAMDVDTYVPGHGFVDSPEVLREELEIYRQAMVQVIETVTELHAAGLSLEEAQAQADFGELGEWSLSSSQGPIAVAQVYRELDGELPPE
ncbi:MAG: MBL fold metallo-hydrolase [Gemmatimonadales bacterium]|nr:MAG: MBL fold metallo-hydrolase [Gemmatimonadales bacterium]